MVSSRFRLARGFSAFARFLSSLARVVLESEWVSPERFDLVGAWGAQRKAAVC
jgi:hypothetical protein